MANRITAGLLLVAVLGCSSDDGGTAGDVPATTAPPVVRPATAEQDPTTIDGLVLDAGVDVRASDVVTSPMSDDQVSTIGDFGPPDRFVLRFVDDRRSETWYYDVDGLEIAFRDGARLYVEPVTPLVVDGLGATPHGPDQFTAGMGLDSFLAVVDAAGYLEEPLDLVGGRLIVVEGVLAGFDDGGLRYVETIPLELD